MNPEQEEALKLKLCGPGAEFELGGGAWPAGSSTAQGVCFTAGPKTLREFCIENFAKFSHREFLVYENERLTFGEVWSRVCALASALSKDFGVSPGDRVIVAMRNYPEWCIAFLAAACMGAIVVPLNSLWRGEEMSYGIHDSGAKVFIGDKDRLSHAWTALQKFGVKAIVAKEAGDLVSKGAVPFQSVVDKHRGAQLPAATIATNDPMSIMYTSGTTSLPKGVVQTNRGVTSMIMMLLLGTQLKVEVAELFKMPVPASEGQPGYKQPCCICPVPLFHVTASHHIFLSSIALGRRCVLMRKWDPLAALKLVDREKPDWWTGVPTMIQDMMQHPDFEKYDTSSLQSLGGGGAPTPAAQVTNIPKKFKAGEAAQGYGLTETNGAVCVISGPDYVARPRSCGAPFPIASAEVVDPDALSTGVLKKLPQGSRGELVIKSPLVMSHYWNKPEKTADALIELEGEGAGWFRTGDIARIDADGFVYIVDRAKDIIIRGGENVSCSEVETAFFEHSAVMECAAFSLPDARLGERVGLCVTLKEGQNATAAELVLFVSTKGQLAKFKTPLQADVFVVREQLPRGATGKILKRALREKYGNITSKL